MDLHDRIIRKPEMLELTGVSNTTLWRMEKAGRFPKRVSLGPNSTGWIKSEYDAWLNNLSKNRDTTPPVTAVA